MIYIASYERSKVMLAQQLQVSHDPIRAASGRICMHHADNQCLELDTASDVAWEASYPFLYPLFYKFKLSIIPYVP